MAQSLLDNFASMTVGDSSYIVITVPVYKENNYIDIIKTDPQFKKPSVLLVDRMFPERFRGIMIDKNIYVSGSFYNKEVCAALKVQAAEVITIYLDVSKYYSVIVFLCKINSSFGIGVEPNELYRNICQAQEEIAADFFANQQAKARATFTWSFSISYISPTDDDQRIYGALSKDIITSLCNIDEDIKSNQGSAKVYNGSTGTYVAYQSNSGYREDLYRALGLLILGNFSTSTIVDIEYRVSKDVFLDKVSNLSLKEVDSLSTFYRGFLAIMNPLNICTRKYDEIIYYSIWEHCELDEAVNRINNLVKYYIDRINKKISDRNLIYEKSVQLVLTLLAASQLEPYVYNAIQNMEWIMGLSILNSYRFFSLFLSVIVMFGIVLVATKVGEIYENKKR